MSNTVEKWTKVNDYIFSKGQEMRIVLPGEQVGKYMRLKCASNVRGGHISSIRHVIVKGLVRQ
jgi:hypothetical protein